MRPLAILILSDDRPGHYHLSEGVAAAIARQRPITVARISLTRRRWLPGRALAAMLGAGGSPRLALRAGYGISIDALPPADLVVSAGGDTLAANVAASRTTSARNIFCGTLRHFSPEAFDLIVTSYQRHASLPRHLVALKPNGLDPDTLPPRQVATAGAPRQRVAGLLVGGNSGLFRYEDAEWRHLVEFLSASHRQSGVRWIVSTSRRTPDTVADMLVACAAQETGPIASLIDFRIAGPGTLPALFSAVDAVLVTEDSSTMLSEAVCARLPVVGVAPAHHAFKDEEREYRAFLTGHGWVKSLSLSQLTPQACEAAFAATRPLEGNHLDRLATALRERLPELFSAMPAR
jgi:hypothetical protein